MQQGQGIGMGREEDMLLLPYWEEVALAVAEEVRRDEGIAPDEVASPKASNGAGNTTKRQDVLDLRPPNEVEIAGLKPVPGYRGERVKFIECVTSSDN